MKVREAGIVIHVRPRSSRAGVEAGRDGSLVVCVHAPPCEGAANRACLAVLARGLGVPRSAVRIVRGEKGRRKEIAVAGLTAEEARGRLLRAAGEPRRR